MENLVSIIIPTYNRGYTIKRAVDSVISQTYKNLEVIIVDDGSTDNTKDVIGKINDSRIRYLPHLKRRGCSAARNTGIKASRGEFIAFLDSDDEYYPDKIEKSIEAARNASSRIGMVSSLFYTVKDSTIEISSRGNINFKRYIPLLSTWVVKRTVFKKIGFFNDGILLAEDAEFFWRFKKHFSFICLLEPLVKKYMLSDRSHASKEKIVKLRKKTISNLRRQRNIKLTARFLNMLGKDYRGQGEFRMAKKYFLMAFETYPVNFGYLINFLEICMGFYSRRCREVKERT